MKTPVAVARIHLRGDAVERVVVEPEGDVSDRCHPYRPALGQEN